MASSVSVFVPAWTVKDEFTDYRAEALACLDRPLVIDGRLGGKMTIHSPPIGVYTLLESMGNAFLRDPATASPDSIIEAAAVAELREKAVPMTWKEYRKDPLRRVRTLYGKKLVEMREDLARFLVILPWTGFRLIHSKTTPEREPWLFGARTIGAVVSSLCETAGCTTFEAIWRIPLTLAGHLAAAKFPPDRVHRRKDPADLKKQMTEAVEREIKGLPHPWQIRFPDDYPPSPEQLKHDPDLARKIRELAQKTTSGPSDRKEPSSHG